MHTIKVSLEGRQSWVPTFAGLWVAVWCTFTAFGVVVPVIPRLVTQELHGSALLVGTAFALAAAVALLFRPWSGQLAQRYGPRRVIAIGASLAIVAGLTYALPLGLFPSRIIAGVAEAMVMTAGSVWAVELAPAGRRARTVGLYGLAMWGGLTAGPALGELAFRVGSYALAWTLAAALPGIALVAMSRLPRGQLAAHQISRRLLPPASVLPGLALAAGAFGYACVTSFGALAMSERGVAGGSTLLSVFGVAYVGVRLVAGQLPDRIGPLPVIVISGIVEAAGLLVIAFAGNWWLATLGAALAGGGFTLLYPSLALIAITTAPESERGATLGAVTSFLDLSVAIAGLAGGVVAGLSYPAIFGLSAALALSAIAAGAAAKRRSY